jgi:anti-sigma B factor antagonist
MAISVRKVKDVVIMDFSGPFTVGESIAEFREEVRRQLDQGMRKFVWNLRDVDSLDSAALGALVSAYTIVRARGGDANILLKR